RRLLTHSFPTRRSSDLEYGRVIRRILAPPAVPRFVGPGAANGAEHVAAEDPRADAVEAAGDVLVVDAGFTAGFAAHLMKRPSREIGRAHDLTPVQVASR